MSTKENLKAAATGQVALSPVAKFSHFLEKLQPQMARALPRHMNADRMARIALTAFSSTPALQDCSFNSIAASIMTAAQMGLEPGINGQGYLIPYKGTCTFVPGWKGLVDLVARAGRASVWTGAVFPGDEFDYSLGDAPFVKHKPEGDGFGEWTHVYAVGRVRDAQMPVIEVWTRAKVERHLKQYNKVGAKHYALKDGTDNFEMYGRKVALLQVLKYMPSSIELANALAVDAAAEAGKSTVLEGDFVRVVEPDPEARVDQETGEIVSPNDAKPEPARKASDALTFAQIAEAIKGAKSKGEAAAALASGAHLPDDQRMDLAGLFNDLHGKPVAQ